MKGLVNKLRGDIKNPFSLFFPYVDLFLVSLMFWSIIVKPFIETLEWNIRWKIKGCQKATSNELKRLKKKLYVKIM